MSLVTTRVSDNSPYFYNFENANETYQMFELDQNIVEYSRSSTNSSIHNKALFYSFLALGLLNTTLNADINKNTFDLFEKNTHTIATNYTSIKDLIKSSYTAEWIDEFFIVASSLKTTKDIYPYYSKISDLVAEQDFDNYNKILDNIDIRNIHEVLMLSLLRIPFLQKDDVSSWNSFLNKTKDELDRRGKNTEKLLKGLV